MRTHHAVAVLAAASVAALALTACAPQPTTPAPASTAPAAPATPAPAPAAPSTAPAPVPAPAGSTPAAAPPAATRATVPRAVGQVLQTAQDQAQAVGFFRLGSTDALGKSRMQVLDRNWKVCSQTPAAGSSATTDTELVFHTVKLEENCP
ncbi:hypothetical protein ACIA6E_20060 [Streptomyces sp. NPDC051815]|uniref:hypothetical protein n=1 Tax=Streptomyces sp. NPDC051815 TaxID=3365674 RepID=UPI00379FC5A3